MTPLNKFKLASCTFYADLLYKYYKHRQFFMIFEIMNHAELNIFNKCIPNIAFRTLQKQRRKKKEKSVFLYQLTATI